MNSTIGFNPMLFNHNQIMGGYLNLFKYFLKLLFPIV